AELVLQDSAQPAPAQPVQARAPRSSAGAPTAAPTSSGRYAADSGTAGCALIRRISSTAAPGRLDTSTSAPYTTAVETPCAAVRPAAPNAHAATPSRGPKPPMLAGSPIARSARNVSGASRESGADAPAVCAAT